MPDPAKPNDSGTTKPGDTAGSKDAVVKTDVGTPPAVDANAALATIANSLSTLVGQANTAGAAIAPPPSSETRPGGRFWVHGRLVDAEGKEIKEDKEKEKEKEKTDAHEKTV